MNQKESAKQGQEVDNEEAEEEEAEESSDLFSQLGGAGSQYVMVRGAGG